MLQQLHDLQAENACTYAQVVEEGLTYQQVREKCATYKDATYHAKENLGLVKPDHYVTPADKIPELVTGYMAFPHIGYSVSDIPKGFIIPGYEFHIN